LAGFFEHGNGPSGFMNGWTFLDKLSEYKIEYKYLLEFDAMLAYKSLTSVS
jgi:hypothetical protein